MKFSLTRALLLFAGLTALITFNVTAKNLVDSPSVNINALVLDKARVSGKGVILGITTQGKHVANFETLLLQQADSNQNYVPLLVAPNAEVINRSLSEINLLPWQLPAFVFYDNQGKEINRVVRINKKAKIPSEIQDKNKADSQSTWDGESLYALSQALERI